MRLAGPDYEAPSTARHELRCCPASGHRVRARTQRVVWTERPRKIHVSRRNPLGAVASSLFDILRPYVGWTGGREPIVELTFETEPQRIWRVRKEFGKNGSSLLQESKNGQGLR